MAYRVKSGTVTADDKPGVVVEVDETAPPLGPRYSPTKTEPSTPAPRAPCALLQAKTGPSTEPATVHNLVKGRTVVRKARPHHYGVVTGLIYNFGTMKHVKEVYVKFAGKSTALPYQVDDLLVVYLN